jgi:circadian clock protein KaiB
MNCPGQKNSMRSSSKADSSNGIMHLRLYIAGGSPNSVRAMANLKLICQHYLDIGSEVEVVDIWQEPERALADGILVTPSLRRLAPQPEVHIIGDLSDTVAVMLALGIERIQE